MLGKKVEYKDSSDNYKRKTGVVLDKVYDGNHNTDFYMIETKSGEFQMVLPINLISFVEEVKGFGPGSC